MATADTGMGRVGEQDVLVGERATDAEVAVKVKAASVGFLVELPMASADCDTTFDLGIARD